MSSNFVRMEWPNAHFGFDLDLIRDPPYSPGQVPLTNSLPSIDESLLTTPLLDSWTCRETHQDNSAHDIDECLITTPLLDFWPCRETHQDNSAHDISMPLVFSVETDEQEESKGVSQAQKHRSRTQDLTPVSKEGKKIIPASSRHNSGGTKVVRTAPAGYLFYCPSSKCNRSYSGKGYHRRGDYANHVLSHHPELPHPDSLASLKEIPRHGPELQDQRQRPWGHCIDMERPSPEVTTPSGPLLSGSGGLVECSSSSSIPSLTYSASTSSMAQSNRRVRGPYSKKRAFGPQVGSCRHFKKRGTSCSSHSDNEEPEQDAIGAANLRYVAQASGSRSEPVNGEIILVDEGIHDPETTTVQNVLTGAASSPLPSSHQHFPPAAQFAITDPAALSRLHDDQRSADLSFKPRTGEPVDDSRLRFGLCKRASLETHYSASPAKEHENQAELSATGSEDVDEDDGSEELSIEEVVAACFGSESARFAVSAFEKIASDGFSSLSGVGDVSRYCLSGTNSSPSSSTEAHLPTPAKTSSSPGSDKRKTPPGGGGGNQGEDQNGKGGGDGGRPFKRPKGDPKAQAQANLRWDCPFGRTPSGVAGSSAGCAETGLQLNDLWYVIIYGRQTALMRVPQDTSKTGSLRLFRLWAEILWRARCFTSLSRQI
ncbi:hypothetical protein CLCR_09762 [Cladophialophora carrionii]|uniref:Uncharacterized protein n=1 Tax=Cladophialophora carrionii TaxID=86049 RepID=A0A1C1CXG9_9EURO|nr:hypothetical protein CLCR_09762 [Cladophialophora carrionii]